jgi:four helix bundle protein
MMQEGDVEGLKERMKRFGLAIIRLAEKLPPRRAARVVANQMVRSGTSPGANYRAACRARSRAEFVSKTGIVEEELDETIYWLEISLDAEFIRQSDADGIIQEGNELLAIVVSSIRTARRAS